MSDRNVRNAIAYGTTTGPVQMIGGVAQVQVRLTALEVFTLKLAEMRGIGGGMPVGTPVVALFVGGDRSNGVVIGSTAPGSTPSSRPVLSGLEDAALYGYGFSVTVQADGVHITGAPDVFIDGNLHVKGEVTAKAAGGSVSLSTHLHPSTQKPTPNT